MILGLTLCYNIKNKGLRKTMNKNKTKQDRMTMKRKVPKSLQTWIITLVIGMLLSKVAVTGFSLLDKVIIRGVLTLAFSLATIIVGVMYGVNLLHGKKEGGKARITIYLILIVILLCAVTSVFAFIKEISKTVLIVLGVISLFIIALIILNIALTIRERKKQFEISQKKSTNQTKPRYARTITTNDEKTGLKIHSTTQDPVSDSVEGTATKELNEVDLELHEETAISLKTIHQLWAERDASKKYLFVTNDENPDLKWVKIWHSPYGRKRKFYGDIMMKNAHDPVNDEIYYDDKPIWKLLEI